MFAQELGTKDQWQAVEMILTTWQDANLVVSMALEPVMVMPGTQVGEWLKMSDDVWLT